MQPNSRTARVRFELATPNAPGRQILAQQREARGIKQGDFAASIGISQSAYSRLEAGESVLNLSQIRNAAMQLGVSPFEILHWA